MLEVIYMIRDDVVEALQCIMIARRMLEIREMNIHYSKDLCCFYLCKFYRVSLRLDDEIVNSIGIEHIEAFSDVEFIGISDEELSIHIKHLISNVTISILNRALERFV